MREAVISFPGIGLNGIDPPSGFTVFGRSFAFYGLIIAIGFLLAMLYLSKRCGVFGLTQDNVMDILLCAVPLGIIGARLYYVAFRPEMYFGPGKWGEIIKIWEGGLAIYGGIIAGVIGIIIYCRVKKIPIGTALDLASFGVLIGQIAGRWGNFFNREAYGAETASFLRMGLTTASGTIYVHPTFLYESVWNLVGLIFLHFFSKKNRKFDGQIFIMYVAWYGLGRFWIEGLRADSLYLWNSGLRVSQVLAGVSFVIAIILLFVLLKKTAGSGKPLYVNREAASEDRTANEEASESDEITEAESEEKSETNNIKEE